MLQFLAVLQEREVAAVGREVGAAGTRDAVEDEGVAGNRDRIALEHAHVAFSLIALHERHADDEDGNAEVSEEHAPVGAGLTEESSEEARSFRRKAKRSAQILDFAENHEGSERAAREDPVAPGAHEKRNGRTDDDGADEAPGKTAGELNRISILPAGERTDRHKEDHREHQRTEDGVEVRRPDRDLPGVQRIEEERIKGAEEHGAHRDNEQNVVDEEHRLARNHREVSSKPHRRRAPCEEEERKADHNDEEGENEETAFRIGCEGMDRREDARADEEGAQERKREGEDCEKHRPDAEASALFRDGERVNQRRAGKPGHEGRILNRIPEPPAAPAEFVIGPVGAERNAEREENPRSRGPGAHPAGPGRVKTS